MSIYGISGSGGLSWPQQTDDQNLLDQMREDLGAYLNDPTTANFDKLEHDLNTLESNPSYSAVIQKIKSVITAFQNAQESIQNLEGEISQLEAQQPRDTVTINALKQQLEGEKQLAGAKGQEALNMAFNDLP